MRAPREWDMGKPKLPVLSRPFIYKTVHCRVIPGAPPSKVIKTPAVGPYSNYSCPSR